MKRRLVFLSALLLLAGCGDSSSSSRPAPPPPRPARPPTPEEAMGLATTTPLAPAVEHWIADTDLGDAWTQAKENVADLGARLVADYKARQESGVGETPSSVALRKDYDLWVSVHDRLKAFVLDCHAAGRVRELPPDLAKHFKDWSALRRDLLRDAPGALDAIENGLAALRADFNALRGSGEPVETRFSAAEALDARAAKLRAEADGLGAGAGETAAHYATDEAVAALAERAADAAADARTLADKVAALRSELHDAETVRRFEAKVAAFEGDLARLDALLAAKSDRETRARALSAQIAEDIRAKTFARLPAHRAAFASLRSQSAAARAGEIECAFAVKKAAKDFPGTFGAKALRENKKNLESNASATRLAAFSKRAETAVSRYGKTFDAALVNLQNASFKLEDGAAETSALAETEKRLARLDALSKR